MNATLLSRAWPLFLGFALIMVGNGLQGTLLGVRATIEGYDTLTIGVIMSCYYFGFLGGSTIVPKLVANVGHIRVFAALASLASSTILVHGVIQDPVLWGLVRILTGFSYAGLFIVVESWLNDLATNKTRGKILALYMLLSHGGMAAGQFLLNLANPENIELFVLVSILISLALLPISLMRRPTPAFEAPSRLRLKELFAISPMGVMSVFTAGGATGSIFALGAVFASQSGMSVAQISQFMALTILGGIVLQMPVGWLSDRFDRRSVIILTCFAAGMAALACYMFAPMHGVFLTMAMLYGGLSMPLYGLGITHTNDHLDSSQFVSASSAMILCNGIGACIGPVTVAALMSVWGVQAFFPTIAVMFMLLGLFGLYRSRVGRAIPAAEQGRFLNVPMRGSVLSPHLFRIRPGLGRKKVED